MITLPLSRIVASVALSLLASLALSAAKLEYRFTTIASASGGSGFTDGPVATAHFRTPTGVSLDSAGNIYVADRENHVVRKISPQGWVSTIAGVPGTEGNTDGPSGVALFSNPQDVAVAADGSVYVANSGSYPAIRRIGTDGQTTTVVSSGFVAPVSLAFAPDGTTLYVADSTQNAIYKVTGSGTMSLLAGGAGAGSADGLGSAAQFNSPRALAVDASGQIYVADTLNYTVRLVSPTGAVTTFAGTPGGFISIGTHRTTASFYMVDGVAVDSAGNVFAASRSVVWKINAAGDVSAFAGNGASTPFEPTQFSDGSTNASKFETPDDISVDASGALVIADSNNHAIRRVSIEGNVSTIVGGPDWAATGMAGPTGASLLPDGNALVSVTGSGTVVHVTPEGAVSAYAGTEGNIPRIIVEPGLVRTERTVDNTRAHFFASSIAIDQAGNIYAPHGHAIRRMNSAGLVQIMAGSDSESGSTDGMGTSARFKNPGAMTVDSLGNVYVADYGNFTIRRISPSGNVTTFAGAPGLRGSTDGLGTAARLDLVSSITIDATDNLWVGSGSTIKMVTPAGLVTTIAGQSNISSYLDGTGLNALLGHTMHLSFDPEGNLLIADSSNSAIRQMAPDTTITTLGGDRGIRASVDGVGTDARFNQPGGITVFPNGNILVADTANNQLRLGVPVYTSEAFFGTYFGTTAQGTPWALWLERPGQGRFSIHLPESDSVLLADIVLDERDDFTASAVEILKEGTGVSPRTIALQGSIDEESQGVVNVIGELTTLGESFTGQFPRTGGGTPFSGSYYTAIALGTAIGEIRTSIGYSGDFLSVIIMPDHMDSARGVLDANGQATVTTNDGYTFELSINPDARTMSATLTAPASSTVRSAAQHPTARDGHAGGQADELNVIHFAGLVAGVDPATRLNNLSVRSQAGSGAQTLVLGFVITGDAEKSVLVRGIGPALTAFDVPGALVDPRLRIFGSASSEIPLAENNDWAGDASLRTAFVALGAFALDDSSRDAALLQSLSAGAFTAQVAGSGGESGIALVEAYDVDGRQTERFVNLSARTVVGTGADVLTAGFVIAGNSPIRLLVRGVGPTLTSFGVDGALVDPVLRLFDSDQNLTAENDNWGGGQSIVEAAATVGAFELAASASADAALLVTLMPGAYTIQVGGVDDTTGVALVEVYEVP
ncbi:SMP-30/gluconolactonase/LRE family protein [Synoicihabitans lomoniglobus]|uniref:SMP-30/gluconolactonase/LRE family protein n=1 Tax=Synoicihabitans lomoniglobus TaxID=2909285 RepID=A0AAF0CM30_9BACT|nr:SMP-30/gluconolactonase/LRE family protein [Opitutaceae bacterium LMO-M01]WED63543.1 SMP-30/gluconolactonase/LRE family protein [Opitutaceae bacterium LMO-M01]